MSRALTLVAVPLVAVTAGVQGGQPAMPEVSYRLTYARAGDESVSIEMAWTPPLDGPRALVMPRAVPMGYGEQRYDAFVSSVTTFTVEGRGVAAEREEGPRWRLAAGTTRVTYQVNLREMEREVRSASDHSRVREGYLGALGYSLVAFVDGFEARPVRVRVEGPATWPVFSPLAPRWPVTSQEYRSTSRSIISCHG